MPLAEPARSLGGALAFPLSATGGFQARGAFVRPPRHRHPGPGQRGRHRPRAMNDIPVKASHPTDAPCGPSPSCAAVAFRRPARLSPVKRGGLFVLGCWQRREDRRRREAFAAGGPTFRRCRGLQSRAGQDLMLSDSGASAARQALNWKPCFRHELRPVEWNAAGKMHEPLRPSRRGCGGQCDLHRAKLRTRAAVAKDQRSPLAKVNFVAIFGR
jgi:hypothetical protein